MDEERLSKDIEQYKGQFLQVQNILQTSGEDGQEGLVKLRDDLVELIHISEESLLSLKKSKLLQLVDEQEQSGSSSSNTLEHNSHLQFESQRNENIEEEDIIGTKCRVSYTQDWGVTQHHNAMVFNIEIGDDGEDELEQAKVRVLFLNPTHTSMVPCPYFLDGKCRFQEDECRYSHGYLVNVEDLKPFKEPNFSELELGQQCLARYTNGVWYKSTIKSINHELHEFVVHYDTYNTDGTLGMDSIFPIDNTDSPEDSEDDASSLSSHDSQLTDSTSNDDKMDDLMHDWKPSGMCLGEWEQHTRGIGSKLMAKMGYIFGKGLGKDGEGRVEPVDVVVLPQGKSLDACAELREKRKLREPFKKKKKKVKVQNIPKQGTVSDVFAFLNHKFGGNKGTIQEIKAAAIHTTRQFDIKDKTRKKPSENDKNTNWNIKLLKVHEEISAAEKQLQKKKQAHQRQSMDKSMSSIFKQKVDDMEHHIVKLKAKEELIQQKIHQKDQHRKLTIF